jgi:hypothetical protein
MLERGWQAGVPNCAANRHGIAALQPGRATLEMSELGTASRRSKTFPSYRG